MATENLQSNNHHRRELQPNTHSSTHRRVPRRRGLSLSRCGNLNNTNVHVMQTNTHGPPPPNGPPPPLEITNNPNNHIQQKNNNHTNNPINHRNHNNHKKPRQKRKTNIWIYLEDRMGFCCVLKDEFQHQFR